MATESQTATAGLIALVCHRLGHPVYNPVSDRDLGRFLEISHTHAGKLRRGEQVMEINSAVRVMKWLELDNSEVLDFFVRLGADALKEQDLKRWFEERTSRVKATKTTRPNNETVKKGSKVAALTGAAILAVLSSVPQPSEARTYETERTQLARADYTLCEVLDYHGPAVGLLSALAFRHHTERSQWLKSSSW